MESEEYPRNAMEFERRFGTEEACRKYLIGVRWPSGFKCPRCSGARAWVNNRDVLVCTSCEHQVSLTAGTVIHGTRKPLQMWFRAMWWVCTQKTGGSAKGLQRLFGLGSYQTAWAWLQKLRRAMIRAGREPLEGPVEVDDGFIGGREQGVVGRQTFKKAKIAVAVEVPGGLRSALGRIRIAQVADFSRKSLVSFVKHNVQPGSTVMTDGWDGYNPLGSHGFVHEVRESDAEFLANVHRVVSLLKRWLLGTHQGAVRPKQLQHYLDEFTFRHNRRKSRHVGKIFYRMLQGVADTTPTPYRRLLAQPKRKAPPVGLT
jgi:transposase-like protein